MFMMGKTKSPSSASGLMGTSCSRSGSTDTPLTKVETMRRHGKTITDDVAIASLPRVGPPHHSPHIFVSLLLTPWTLTISLTLFTY